MNEKIARIEALIARTGREGRDIGYMAEWTKGNLEKAAESILSTHRAHVGILTGFYITYGDPPSPEPDGLGGMAHVAAALGNIGIPVTVITDAPCAKAVWAVVDALPVRADLEVASISERSVRRLRESLEEGDRPMTHLIAIERVSPAADGKPHRASGWDMTRETAPLHLLFEDNGWQRPWTTIGIGDGGNEIGMGSLPKHLAARIPNDVAGIIPADHLLVAGVSNWAGYGLIAAMACLKPALAPELLHHLNREMDHRFLKTAVEIGQVVDGDGDGVRGRPMMSVDKIPWEQHAALLEDVVAIAKA